MPTTPPVGGKGGVEPGGAAVLSQLAGATGGKAIANAIALYGAWKAFPGLLGRVNIVGAAVIGTLKSIHSAGEQHKKTLYELTRQYGASTTSVTTFNKAIKELSVSVGRDHVEMGKLVVMLKNHYTTANLSNVAMQKLVKTMATEFPFALEKATQDYQQFLTQLPKGAKLIEKEILSIRDLADVYDATGGNISDFLRIYTRLHGLVPLVDDALTEHERKVKAVGAGWKRGYAELQVGATEFFNNFIDNLGREGIAIDVAVLQLLGFKKAASDLWEAGIGAQEREWASRAIKDESALTELERMRLAAITSNFLEYMKFRKEKEFEMSINDQIMRQYDAHLGILEATYQPMTKMADIWMQQINILEQNYQKRVEIVDKLSEQLELDKLITDEAKRKLAVDSTSKALETAEAERDQAALAVAQKEAYVRRSFMEQMLQLQLGLSKGTYTMPTTMGEGLTKGPGYSPFAPLERGGKGGREWGSYTAEGKFEARPQTGPYEKFYQRLFGGAAGWRSPHEKVVEEKLTGIDDSLVKMSGGSPSGGPQLQKGGFVKKTGMAVVHAGEWVMDFGRDLDSAIAQLWNKSKGGGDIKYIASAIEDLTTATKKVADWYMSGRYGQDVGGDVYNMVAKLSGGLLPSAERGYGVGAVEPRGQPSLGRPSRRQASLGRQGGNAPITSFSYSTGETLPSYRLGPEGAGITGWSTTSERDLVNQNRAQVTLEASRMGIETPYTSGSTKALFRGEAPYSGRDVGGLSEAKAKFVELSSKTIEELKSIFTEGVKNGVNQSDGKVFNES